MADRRFQSLYGFSFNYPADWTPDYGLERITFQSENADGDSAALILSFVQTSMLTRSGLVEQLHTLVSKAPDVELVDEQPIELDGRAGHRCTISFQERVSVESDETVGRLSYVVGLPLHRGNLAMVLTFIAGAERFSEFVAGTVQPTLDSLIIDRAIPLPIEGYRRIARDRYRTAIDIPDDWLITGLDEQKMAFRSLEQRWQIDNVTLVTAVRPEVHPVYDYFKLALANFRASETVELIETRQSTLGGLPAYTIEYTLLDTLQVVNSGRQIIAVAKDGMLVNVTTLAPKSKLEEYEPVFAQVLHSLQIHPE